MAHLALDLANTIVHDGHGGVRDELPDPAALTTWVRQRHDVLGQDFDRFTADEQTHGQVLALRTAVRSLFARAVLPGPPSKADAGRLPPAPEALAVLNDAAAAVPVAPHLDWPDGRRPRAVTRAAAAGRTPRLLAALAGAGIEFLGGPGAERLRACPAPRCVRYFLREHSRQQWCKPSCGNRARVHRHYHARTEPGTPGT
ncbi:CGNR zinc finger domain-containing protein [Amycolatopsis suaedae]|uniref:CGNR zinc finger domain-containing protein n=1 Tax=Amycolatopsis suaedae TaxID=2510978 RepID=UPI001F0F454B|nr:ABATE domain-containing protein [Amycolatopsis suaedae]